VEKANELIKAPSSKSFARRDFKTAEPGPLFNNSNSIQSSFYWKCMSPKGGGEAKGPVADAIKKSLGHFDASRRSSARRRSPFRSGWAWLVRAKDGSIQVVATHDAGCPVREGQTRYHLRRVGARRTTSTIATSARSTSTRMEAGQLDSRTRICDSRYSTATRSRLPRAVVSGEASTYDAAFVARARQDASSYQITIFSAGKRRNRNAITTASVENCQWSQLWTDDWWVR